MPSQSTHLKKSKLIPATFVTHQEDQQSRLCLKILQELGQATLPHVGHGLGPMYIVLFTSDAKRFPGNFLCINQESFARYGVKIPVWASGECGKIAVRNHDLDYLYENRDRLTSAIGEALRMCRKYPSMFNIPKHAMNKLALSKK